MFSNLYAEATNVVAQGPAQRGPASLIMNIVPFVLIFVIFYFLLIRPQKKKQKQHQDMINSIKQGEKVLLNAGFKGTVKNVKDNGYFVVEIAQGVEVEVLKSAIVNVLKD